MVSRCIRNLAAAVLLLVSGIWTAPLFAQGFSTRPTASSLPNAARQQAAQSQRTAAGPSLSATDEIVVDIRVEGNETVPTSHVLSQVQSRVGRPFDPEHVRRDALNLAQHFHDVRVLNEQTPQGRIIIFQVFERPLIKYVEFQGNIRIKDKHLLKEVGLEVGDAVDPYQVEEGRRKLVELYKSNGYSQAQVTVVEGNRPNDKGVFYSIHEGNKQRVRKVDFVGVDFVSERRLKTQIESKAPTMYLFKGLLDIEQVDQDVERIRDYYRAFGFFQARVSRTIKFDDEGEWADLTFVVHEGPRYSVRNVTYTGNRVFASESFNTYISLPSGTEFERAKMSDDVQWIKDLYGSRGFVFADVQAEIVYLEQPGLVDLVYDIEEGKQWRVGRIFVHINGEEPHTRIFPALNRITLRPGQIVDTREIAASQRRLQASSLFLTDPIQGITPTITYHIRELDDVDFGSAPSGPGYRGQSPDPGVDAVAPGVYEVRRPPTEAVHPDSIEVHFTVEAPAAPAAHSGAGPGVLPPPQSGQPQGTVHPQQAVHPPGPAAPPAAEPRQSLPPQNPYSSIQVRYQSPYQDLPPGYVSPGPVSTPGYGTIPAATGPESNGAGQGYAAQTNGQMTYSVQQAQYETLPPGGTEIVSPPFGPLAYPPSPPIPGGAVPGYMVPHGVVPPPPITPIPPLGPTPGGWDPGTVMVDQPFVDLNVNLYEAQTGRIMVGAGINSDAGVVGQILLDEQNFDWRRWPTSFNDFATGRAFRGNGERFRLEAQPGTEVQRYLVSFQDPYLWDTPIGLGLSGSFYDRRFSDWDEQRTGGRVSLSYQFTQQDLSASFAYRGEIVNIHDIAAPIPELTEVLGDNTLHGFRITVANDTRDNPFLATSGHYIEYAFEQVIGDFVYPRATIDLRKYFLVRERPDHSGRHVLSLSTRLGITGDDTPIYDNFYAGGFSTLRGFDFRGASPVQLPQGVQVGGEFMWINSVEYLFPISADDMMHGAVFCDFGTVERNVEIEDFRVAPGFGLRLTVPAMGPMPIALDFAFPVLHADFDDTQIFSFNMGLQR